MTSLGSAGEELRSASSRAKMPGMARDEIETLVQQMREAVEAEVRKRHETRMALRHLRAADGDLAKAARRAKLSEKVFRRQLESLKLVEQSEAIRSVYLARLAKDTANFKATDLQHDAGADRHL